MTYAGIPEEYSTLDVAKIVLIPVPYDGTSTWIKGSDKGPEAFLDASANMELYDIETNSEVYKQGVYLANPVNENSSPEKMVDAVHKTALDYLNKGKFVTLFGGEHSVSIGSIRAFKDKFVNLTVLQFDAHADLRKEYEDSSCNHACAVHEAQFTTNLVQIGIRSMDIEEKQYMKDENCFFSHQIHANPNWMKEALSKITDNVFITIDLDAFDSSIMPSTGTPEPGGLNWFQIVDFIRLVAQHKNIVGFDIMELCPNKVNKGPDFLAAKLYYKILSYVFNKK
ncbi:MAG: agmatinase [Bacteroidetes bacterium GWF2_33_16]|nr:MAG: agmatinase [Bacteroidetes bacterium GWE2_32_14]OFY04771.1 MAG: agmatinase [Bacteroidetes bacterium GWF2_33_16]